MTLAPSKAAFDIIKEFEGCKLVSYRCPAGVWTIGWGATGPGIGPGVEWSQAQADARLEQDVRRFAAQVAKVLDGAKTTQAQFDALVSFAYNLGIGALGSSTLLKLHKAGDYKSAAAQFVRWNKADGKVLKGLTRRREIESLLYSQ